MQFHPNELFLIYDPRTNAGKQTKAMAMSICSHINEVDMLNEKLSPTYWKEIVNMLGIFPNEMLDHSHPEYKKIVMNNTFTMDGWMQVLVNNAHLISGSIVIFNNHAVFCNTPTDILKLKPKANEKTMPHLKNYIDED
ncbi:MAG: hypothetical protein OEU76_08110 [Cyclobacteriaceae bacterium]|nr:hypothetical protein [Cyclobacteriaceae bacterium]